jgi:hypothetical protein
MDQKPASPLPIENAADYVDALLRRPENELEWIRKIVPARRMRDKVTHPARQKMEDRQPA